MPGQRRRSRFIPWLLAAVLLALGLPIYLVLSEHEAPSPIEKVAGDDNVKAPTGSGLHPSSAPANTASKNDLATTSAASQDPAFHREWFAPWGNGPGQLGKRQPREGAPEGPMGFAVLADGSSVVLDQVNQRLVFFQGGRATRTIALDRATYEDLWVDEQRRVWLVDRLAGRQLVLLDDDGRQLGQVALEGRGVPEGGAVTGLFVYEDGAWVEVEHSRQVHIGDENGRALDERQVRPGRPTRDGRLLVAAAREGRRAAVITVRPLAQPQAHPRVLARVTFPLPVLHLLLLDSDTEGNLYLGAYLAQFSSQPPYGPVAEKLQVVVVGANGAEIDRIDLAGNAIELEQFRQLLVTADGAVYQLWLGADGVELRRVR